MNLTKLCDCTTWARNSISAPYHMTGEDGLLLITNHHERCKHFNDSLIEVWKVSDGHSSYYDTSEPDAFDIDLDNDEITVEKVTMHKEIYDNLPEFDGF
jgi:hypothetical protein